MTPRQGRDAPLVTVDAYDVRNVLRVALANLEATPPDMRYARPMQRKDFRVLVSAAAAWLELQAQD